VLSLAPVVNVGLGVFIKALDDLGAKDKPINSPTPAQNAQISTFLLSDDVSYVQKKNHGLKN
jgi:hypothetical protein